MNSKSPNSSQLEIKVVVPSIIMVEQQENVQNLQLMDAGDEPSVINRDDQSVFGTGTEQGLFMMHTNTQGDGNPNEERFSLVNTERDFTSRMLQSKKNSILKVSPLKVPQGGGLSVPPP